MNYYQNNIVNQIDFYCYEKFNDFDLLYISNQKKQIYFNRTKNDGINIYKETKTTNLVDMMEYNQNHILNDTDIPKIYSNNVCKCGLFHKVKLIYSEKCGYDN